MKKYEVKLIETYAFALKSKQTTEWKRKKKPKNMSTSIKLINSLSVLPIGYLKLFLK